MTQRFILDENIAILAQQLENDKGEEDITCRRLFDVIIEVCHSIVFDPALWEKYYRHLRNLPPDQPHGPRSLLRLLYLAVEREGKIHNTGQDARPFPEEAEIPQGSQDDVPIVRLAVETKATLVTTDESLRRDLNSCGVQERYDLQVLTPEQALAGL
jgi:rRNA-processing protein FCF1